MLTDGSRVELEQGLRSYERRSIRLLGICRSTGVYSKNNIRTSGIYQRRYIRIFKEGDFGSII
jgi:hypothetical protein